MNVQEKNKKVIKKDGSKVKEFTFKPGKPYFILKQRYEKIKKVLNS